MAKTISLRNSHTFNQQILFLYAGHPNVKAFISHGGLLGTMEAVHTGTPMVIMPQFGDQHTNAQAMSKAGGGVILYMSEANEESIYQALKSILEPK